jgi:ketosteroid isomerase-like protein
MASTNVEVVRTIYELWARDESPRDLIADDLEYVNPPYAVESGVSRGRGVLAKIRDVYPDFRVRPERFIDAGEDVVVPVTVTGTSVSGLRLDTRQVYVWTIRSGTAVRFRWFNKLDEALAAVGLSADQAAAE